MIRGDIAASAAGWALVLRWLIRHLKGGAEGISALTCLPVCVHNPSKRGGRAKRFAYRRQGPDTGCGRDADGGSDQTAARGTARRRRRDGQQWTETV